MKKIKELLSKKYQINLLQDLADSARLPITDLSALLKNHKKDTYTENEKLIFLLNFQSDLAILKYIRKTVDQLNIPKEFILIVSNQKDLASFVVELGFSFLYFPTELKTIPDQTNFNIPETICINPWINFWTGFNESYRPCCEFRDDTNNNIYYLNSITDAYLNDYLTDVRVTMLAGTEIPQCQKCYSEELLGKQSKRIRDNYVYRDYLETIDWNTHSLNNLRSLDITLENTCNLTCRICNPTASSHWNSIVRKHKQIEKIYPIGTRSSIIDNLEFWKNSIDDMPNIRYINFQGGEPFLSKQHLEILDHLIASNKSQDISLHYISNGTQYPENLLSRFKQFKKVGISFSIDDISQRFEYARQGANWQTVDENLNKFLKLDPEKFYFDIYCTVSIFNLPYLSEIYQYANSKLINVEFNILDGPEVYSFSSLDAHAKDYVLSLYNTIIDQNLKIKIDPILTKLTITEYQEKNRIELKKIISQLDEIFNTNFAKTYSNWNKFI